MQFILISGSTRVDSTNTQLLNFLAKIAPPHHNLHLFDGIKSLPIFSPDLEDTLTPPEVIDFCTQIKNADGIIISSPEYIRAIPGGLKNAIDWLVQREQIIHKPVALIHASHRGEDMLHSLCLVLDTVTENFQRDNFLAFPLMSKSPGEIVDILRRPENKSSLLKFLNGFEQYVLEHLNT